MKEGDRMPSKRPARKATPAAPAPPAARLGRRDGRGVVPRPGIEGPGLRHLRDLRPRLHFGLHPDRQPAAGHAALLARARLRRQQPQPVVSNVDVHGLAHHRLHALPGEQRLEHAGGRPPAPRPPG